MRIYAQDLTSIRELKAGYEQKNSLNSFSDLEQLNNTVKRALDLITDETPNVDYPVIQDELVSMFGWEGLIGINKDELTRTLKTFEASLNSIRIEGIESLGWSYNSLIYRLVDRCKSLSDSELEELQARLKDEKGNRARVKIIKLREEARKLSDEFGITLNHLYFVCEDHLPNFMKKLE